MILGPLTVLAPIVASASIGSIWCKKDLSFDTDQVTTLVTYIGTPCLVFATLTNVDIEWTAVTQMAAVTALTILCFAIFGATILRLFRLSLLTYLPPVIWANMGNMGLPLCLFAFGLEGAVRGVLILEAAMPVAVYNYFFAERYNRAPSEIVRMIVISTVLSFLTLPALLLFVL